MDRLSHLRGEAGGSRDSTLDTTSPPSESFMTANESSSKYFSLSEVDSVDSTFDISSIKDVSLASTTTDSEGTMTNADELISNLSPIGKKSDMLDSYKIGKQIEAANILSGGVDIFDDNDNSYDGDELVIDDNVDDDKSNSELKQPEEMEFKSDENMIESTLINEETDIASKDTEVVLQIDGKNVDAIDIGNGLYLYRKEGQEELAAVQIIDDDQQQTSFKFLKVRENAEGNLEVYEEIEIEVPKEVPAKEGKMADKKISSHVPIKDINKVISESACNKVAERKIKAPRKEPILTTKITEVELEVNKETSPDGKSEFNKNGKMIKFSESRKSPVIGSFTPMTYHSTPNKERIPLTKTMVEQQLHPNRHSDNVKKTIEVHTDSCKQRTPETPTKNKYGEDNKTNDIDSPEKEMVIDESLEKVSVAAEETVKETIEENNIHNDKPKPLEPSNDEVLKEKPIPNDTSVPIEQENIIDSTEKDVTIVKAIFNKNLQSEIENEKKKIEMSGNIVDIDEDMEEDLVIVETVAETVETAAETVETAVETVVNKDEAITEDLVKTDSDKLEKVNDDIQKTQAEVKISEPIQVINKDVEFDATDKSDKAVVKDNTQCDKQDETKVEEIIYDITDQENDDIIIIDDSELDETKIEEPTSAADKGDLKVENIKSHDQESEKIESNVATKNKEDESKIKESVQENNKKVAENVQADTTSAVILDTHKEQIKKVEMPKGDPQGDIVKNNQSKIPIAKPDTKKEITKPTSNEISITIKPTTAVDVKEGKVELKPEPSKETGSALKEVVKDIVLDTKSSQPIITPEESQKPVKTEKPQVIPKVVPEVLVPANKTPLHISPFTITKTETAVLKRKNNVFEKSPKKESKKPIPIAESQSNVVPMEVDSTTNVKAEASGKSPVSSSKVPSSEVKEQKPVTQEPLPGTSFEVKPQGTTFEPKASTSGEVNVKVSQVPKEEQPSCSGTQDVSSTSTDSLPNNDRNEGEDDSEEPKPGGSKKAVPFGKWTATNRKEFLDKIKNRNTTPAPPAVPSTSTNQLKSSNDLNRRDVLQKIDSQRQQSSSAAAALAKTQEGNKVVKNETAFVSKANQHKDNNTQESKSPLNVETGKETSEAEAETAAIKQDVTNDIQNEDVSEVASVTSLKKEAKVTEVNYQDLIDKTIEDMIQRTVGTSKAGQDEPNQSLAKDANAPPTGKFPANYQPTDQATLDEIEMKMNELHGIPFIERPPHELPVVPLAEPKLKTISKVEKEKPSIPIKTTKIPNLLPFPNKTQQKIIKESVIEVDSEDEMIEHEPITGDIDINKKTVAAKLPPKEKVLSNANTDKSNTDTAKKEPIITEKDFDKFARRNSITYENCLTMNFDSKDPHNVIQTVVEKDPYPKTYSRNDIARVDKPKMPYKYQNARQPIPAKVQTANKLGATEDSSTRNQSKLQKAYQSALSAKRQKECPITIIEDKPVKVVFMDNMEYVPSSLNIQGQQLSPAKKLSTEPDSFTLSTLDSLESDVLDTTDDAKSQEEVKTKTKHQRKQVLTPVDEPELELIEPKDLGLEVSPKKKRKTDDDRMDKNVKYPIRKKYYLLGSNTAAEDKYTHSTEIIKNPLKETVNRNDNGVAHKNAVSAIDSLVKAAELLEHQSENRNIIDSPTPGSQQSTPVKRGRGRPRKYPLPEEGVEKKVPSPQKKPRLIDAKVPKRDTVMTTDDEDDDVDSDGQLIKENWTMGKINENIVCPICNKLFRTENVVFKHVKHCTGPSPSRSGSDKRSPRRMRPSQESDSKSQGSKSDDMDLDDDKPLVVRKETPKKRKSKDSISKSDDRDDIIVIEDTPPVKERAEKKEKEVDERKIHESRKPRAKIFPKTNDLVCEFCGKTFRQLSYLVSHKLQHKTEEPKKIEKEAPVANKSVYSCEVCKKEFRKLHHLVQHRNIHDHPSSAPARSLRKSSSEQSDTKVEKEPSTSKLSEDPSTGFRCEPCDKSFRKLHHLVEHRETHDGINRQKTTPTVVPNNVEKPVTLHQCEVCKKTFKKLSHLIEHKEQHVETSSEKSDDKSVKSSLSTRDIIHECSLCYMVFPNEHSLNKHTIICQRKKRQSKQAKAAKESEATAESVEDASQSPKIEEKLDDVDSPKLVIIEDIIEDEHEMEVVETIELSKEIPKAAEEKPVEVVKEVEKEVEPAPQKIEIKPVEPPVIPAKREFSETEVVKTEVKPEVPEKIKKVEIKEAIKVHETPKKKTSIKEKSTGSASKRVKTTAPVAVPEETKPAVESSDDDEVRYMLNPNFKVEEPAEEKVFMKVRANKRSSLQIERPNSKDLVKRRTSLQHPPKIPRLKPKAVEPNPVAVKHVTKAPKLEPVSATDSDDSETVKYSFPKTIPEKTSKPARERTPKTVERKTQKKTLADKRKSLSGIAKRKSLGKTVTARHKPTPVKQIKRRTLEAEHRCDCGQLFSSAALLARHTTLAHTPPRVRARRDLAPEGPPRQPSVADETKQAPASRKSSARSDSSASTNTKPNKNEAKPTRKTLDKETKTPAGTRKPKPEKSEAKSSVKPKRTPAHRGVPVPEKMRKLMQKNNK